MSLFTWSDDRFLRYATLGFVVFWLASVGPVRTWASEVGLRSVWWFGVAPSFFAGGAFATWQALATRVSGWLALLYAVCLVSLAEAIQLVMPNTTPDLWDILAGCAGATLGGGVVAWRERIGEHPSRQGPA